MRALDEIIYGLEHLPYARWLGSWGVCDAVQTCLEGRSVD